MSEPFEILLRPGSPRDGSTNAAALRAAAAGRATPTGGADAHDSLRKVLGYVHARFVEEAGLRLPDSRSEIGEDGLVADAAARDAITGALVTLSSS